MKTICGILLQHKDNRAGILEFARRCEKRAKAYTATAYPYITYATAYAADAADTAAATAVATSTDAAAATAAYGAERAKQRADLVAIFGEGEL